MPDAHIQSLVGLGLNHLEAEVYALLVSREPVTAYRIGQLLKKPTANIYKSIESLQAKGAVLVEEGSSRHCRAVPVAEFLRQLEGDFLARTHRAAHALAGKQIDHHDERIYQLQSVPHILERCRTMLDGCEKIALIDAFPGPLQAIMPAILNAASRGVDVYLLAYQKIDVPGVQVAVAYQSEEILTHWSSQQLNVVVDGMQVLLALLNQGLSQTHQAIWSESLYLSCMLHAGMMREHTVHQLTAVQESEHAGQETRRILSQQKFFHNTDVPGQNALFQRFAPDRFGPDRKAS